MYICMYTYSTYMYIYIFIYEKQAWAVSSVPLCQLLQTLMKHVRKPSKTRLKTFKTRRHQRLGNVAQTWEMQLYPQILDENGQTTYVYKRRGKHVWNVTNTSRKRLREKTVRNVWKTSRKHFPQNADETAGELFVVQVHICICVYMYIRIYVYMYICIYVYMCIRIYVYMYIPPWVPFEVVSRGL